MSNLKIINGAASSGSYAVLAAIGGLELSLRPLINADHERNRSGEVLPDGRTVQVLTFRLHVAPAGYFEGNPVEISEEMNGVDSSNFGLHDYAFRTKGGYQTKMVSIPFAYEDITSAQTIAQRLPEAASFLLNQLTDRAASAGATLSVHPADILEWLKVQDCIQSALANAEGDSSEVPAMYLTK